jgi:hypothetical protein
MKRNLLALAAVAALFSTPVFATADFQGWAYNGMTGWGSFDGNHIKDSGWASNPTIGYRWGTFGIDAGYAWFGNFQDKVGNVKVDFDLGGWTAGVNVNGDLSDKWAVQGRVGVFGWDASAHTNVAGVRVKESDNGTDYYIGVAIDYNFTKRYSLGLGYAYYNVGGAANASVGVFGVTSEFRF